MRAANARAMKARMGESLGLVADALACERGGRLLFEALSFGVDPGGALLVTGANGAGKSSLLRMLAGLLPPARGRIERPHRTAWLGHDCALKEDQRVIDELSHWARIDGAARGASHAALARFGLDGLADLPVRLLSSGQRRRTALARLWQTGARLWLLDEPGVGLDAPATAALETAIAAHRAEGGLVVATSHVLLAMPGAAVLELGRR